MFTVKHVSDTNERLFTIDSVNLQFDGRILWLFPPHGEEVMLTDGVAYVMNDLGKTVATYRLQTPPPHFLRPGQMAAALAEGTLGR